MLDIFSYIEERSLTAALRLYDRFLAAFQNLAKRPGIGHKRDDPVARDVGVLFWPVGSYLVYRIAGQTIEIVRVLSGYRDVALILSAPLDENP
jgi:plasmid stabilization system protein ParE